MIITEIIQNGTINILGLTRSQAFQLQTAMRRLSKLNPIGTPQGKRDNEAILEQIDDVLLHYSKLSKQGQLKV